MKKNLRSLKSIFSIIALFSAVTANAQFVTISETHQLPAIGDTLHYVDANTFGFDPTGTGPVTAKVWDESLLLNAGTTYEFYYVDPATIPTGFGSDSFPTATIARGESGPAGYFYYENTLNNINRIGWFLSNSNYGIYENGTYATEFHFPITAGNTSSSSYAGRFAPFNLGEDSVKLEMGTLTINADMQGTLMLPTGTFTNVLRIHGTETFHIVTYLLGFPAVDNLIQDDYYYWFVDTILQPILIYGITTVDGTQQTPVLRYQPFPGSTTGIHAIRTESISIYPNPSDGKFIIENYTTNFGDYNLEIYNMTGVKILYAESKQQTSSEIDISDAPKGVYFLKIYSGQKVLTEKIVIQ